MPTQQSYSDYSKIKFVIFTLSILTFIFAAIGGSIYYFKVRNSLLKETRQRCITTVDNVNQNISLFLRKYKLAVKTLSNLEEIKIFFINPSHNNLKKINYILDVFSTSFQTEACYLMDIHGNTIASSNRHTKHNFVGKNFSFRPYFKQAMQGKLCVYPALGTTSHKRGVYFSAPIYGKTLSHPIGVAVIKTPIEYLESSFLARFPGIFFFIDPNGIIFISNKSKWLFHSITPLDAKTIQKLKASRQMGDGPWPYSGFKFLKDKAWDKSSKEYLVFKKAISFFPGWNIFYLLEMKYILKNLHKPIIEIGGPVILIIMFLIGILVYFLSKIAHKELKKRELVEKQLRISENKYRSIYHKTPAMLHSIDRNYRLLRVSDFWLEATGYSREEVIGKKLTEFFTPSSKKRAEQRILPIFFKKGFLKNFHYQFVKKNGEVMDILLSCYGIRNEHGEVVETLAISVDVTERLKEQKQLREAKKKLSQYSRQLEELVKQRSMEIDAILRYTPSIIYLKDKQLRYKLVNPGFEKLFQVSNEWIQGKQDEEVLPKEIAIQFEKNDKKALQQKKYIRSKEIININKHSYTFWSIKSPICTDNGEVTGVVGISTDITELEKTQKKLKQLSKNIIKNQEIERARIAKELHDELGQILTVLNMDAHWLEKKLKKIDDQAASRAKLMQQLIDKTIDEVRNLAFQLRPSTLDHLGLIEALESLLSDFEKRTNIVYTFTKSRIPELDDTTTTAIYRIVQEAITNAIRHAAAQKIDISVSYNDTHLQVRIKDNGKGFDTKSNKKFSGFGIVGMKERAELIGGKVVIISKPNKGTEVICTIPV